MNKFLSRISLSSKQFIVGGLIVISFLFYAQTLSFSFLNFDDDKFITQNEVVSSDDSSFADCFSYKYKEHDYFPLTYATFRLLRLVFGFNPVVFHGLNLLLHILNVILIFFLTLKLLGEYRFDEKKREWFAAVTALLFSINPLHVESVSWIIDLKDILFTAFYLAGMLTYWKWLENGKLKWYYVTFFFALLSILTKSTAITFIAILFLIDFINRKKWDRELLLVKLPFLLLTLAGFYFFGLFTNPDGALLGITGKSTTELAPYFPGIVASFPVIFQRIVIASFRLGFWVVHSIFPFQLNLFLIRRLLLDQYAAILPFVPFLVAGVFILAWFLRKKLPLLLWGLLFLLITLSPAFAKSDIGISIFVPDRYMYLPVLGLLWALLSLLFSLKKEWIMVAIVILFGFWSFQTLNYLPKWKNNYTLYGHCLKINPNSPVPRANRGMSYLNEGKKDEAFADFDYFIKNIPEEFNPLVYLNRGVLYAEKGDTTSALADFQTILERDSVNFGALFNCGNISLARNELEDARSYFSKAYDVDTTNYLLNKKISSLYNRAGNHAVALQFANRCLAKDSTDTDLMRIKGMAFFYLGKSEEAVETFSDVIKKSDKYDEIWYYRALARYGEKDYRGALTDLEEAQKRGVVVDVNFGKMLRDSLSAHK